MQEQESQTSCSCNLLLLLQPAPAPATCSCSYLFLPISFRTALWQTSAELYFRTCRNPVRTRVGRL
jgi:hypothetical protein